MHRNYQLNTLYPWLYFAIVNSLRMYQPTKASPFSNGFRGRIYIRMKCAQDSWSSSPLLRQSHSFPGHLMHFGLWCTRSVFVIDVGMRSPLVSDCSFLGRPGSTGSVTLPSPPRPVISFSDLDCPLFCFPGVERRCHSDFLLSLCCLGRSDHSFFLQQIPQQLLQVCGGTSNARGRW